MACQYAPELIRKARGSVKDKGSEATPCSQYLELRKGERGLRGPRVS